MTDSIKRLYQAVLDSQGRDPAMSRTAKLLNEGTAKMAKKLAISNRALADLDAWMKSRAARAGARETAEGVETR